MGMPCLNSWSKAPRWTKLFQVESSITFGSSLKFSDAHSTLVANVCHLSTRLVSSHYYLLFDDRFYTAFSTRDDALLDGICNQLFDSFCDLTIMKTIYCLLLIELDWMSLSNMYITRSWRNLYVLLRFEIFDGLIRLLITLLIYFQTGNDKETLPCLSPVFVPEGGNGAYQPAEMRIPSIVFILQQERPLTFCLLNLLMLLLSLTSDSTSAANFYNPD